jgi:glycosyltransferase involved in cell wall biosynthesis
MGRAAMLNIENVVFIFVGGGLRKKELLDELSFGEQKNLIVLPFQPNENFNNILTASHVQIVTLREGLEGMAVPCKIYGIMAAGIPTIAMVPEQSEIAFVVREENCGVVLGPCDIEGLKRIITTLKTNINLREQMGQNGRKAFEKKYTTKIIAEKYKRVLDELYL